MNTIFSTADYETQNCGRNGATIVWIVLSSVTLALATLLVPIRLFVRIFIVHGLWWDDAAIITAWMLLVPHFALLWRMTVLGLGRWVSCVSHEDLVGAIELEDITEFLQVLGTMFSRLSVALFCGRLFGSTKTFRFLLWGGTAFMCIAMILTAILSFTVCYPVKAQWGVQVGSKTSCTATGGIGFRNYFNGIVGFISDLMLALIPVYFLSNLQMAKNLKLSLGALMAVGLIPAGCCLTRTLMMSNTNYDEPLKYFAKVVLFGGIEASTMVICAIIPTLRPLFLQKHRRSTIIGIRRLTSPLSSRTGSGATNYTSHTSFTNHSSVINNNNRSRMNSIATVPPIHTSMTRNCLSQCPTLSGETLISDSFRNELRTWCSFASPPDTPTTMTTNMSAAATAAFDSAEPLSTTTSTTVT